jgi:1-acyl-sn-glycerol-3-phosphate acyltransferase
VVNAAMSAMRMFPPFLRDKGDDRLAFNRWAVERCVEELAIPGTVMGLHPEGRRGTGPDPYTLLPAQPGVGRIALGAEGVHIIPAFVLGLQNDLRVELERNWTSPDEHRIDVSFGAPIDLSDLRAKGVSVTTALRASKRCSAAIEALGAQQRLRHDRKHKLANNARATL